MWLLGRSWPNFAILSATVLTTLLTCLILTDSNSWRKPQMSEISKSICQGHFFVPLVASITVKLSPSISIFLNPSSLAFLTPSRSPSASVLKIELWSYFLAPKAITSACWFLITNPAEADPSLKFEPSKLSLTNPLTGFSHVPF